MPVFGEERGGLVGSVPPAVVGFSLGRVGVASGALDVVETVAVLKGGCDERSPHRASWKAAVEAELAETLSRSSARDSHAEMPRFAACREDRADFQFPVCCYPTRPMISAALARSISA